VQPETLLGQAGRERRRVRPVPVTPLNRLVRDEPRVPPAADAARRAAPSRDVRLILIGNAKGEAIEACLAGRREVEDEFVAVVEVAIAVDRL
jgi:hypothetical protein